VKKVLRKMCEANREEENRIKELVHIIRVIKLIR
jgi:hypothetical protein